MSRVHLGRVLVHPLGNIFWEHDREFLRLRSASTIISTTGCELPSTTSARRFPVCVLDTRQRRGAAIAAAVVADQGAPRSWHFIRRFTFIDRATVRGWLKDPVIVENILAREARWIFE